MKKILFILFAGLIIVSCKPESSAPDELIDEETYERMFAEFAIINQLDEQLLSYTSREELRNKVYEHYGVTEEEFRISHEYYEQNIDAQLERVQEITKMLRAERDTAQVIQRQFESIPPEKLDSLRQSLSGME
ncbi:MAG: DUF4296 domain-containing protein [Balneolaceae bacterium]|nr:DUF4296 domain-containing protein [Balneolaceae bacterium]